MAARTTTRTSDANFGSRTDIGCVRKHNEDSLIVSPPLFVVADGMGGHAAGEVASEIAVNTIAENAPEHADARMLGEAVEKANREIILAAQDGRGREGMGTTVTAAMLEGERLIIAQVGDSRAYLLHQGSLQQITRDHSLVADMIEAGQLTDEEARVHPNRSMITRALGSDLATQADLYEINVEPGDRLLLCSDGLSGMVVDKDIEETLQRVRDPQRCANDLVNAAIAAGGHDNVTVIIVDIKGFGEVKEKKAARKIKASAILTIIALVAVFVAAGFGLNYYVDTSAYLIEQEGKVAVYRGVQGEILGFKASSLEYVSDIKTEDLQPGVASRIEEGLKVDNLQAAEKLLEEYKTEIDEHKSNATGQGQQGSNITSDQASYHTPSDLTNNSTTRLSSRVTNEIQPNSQVVALEEGLQVDSQDRTGWRTTTSHTQPIEGVI